MPAQEILIYIGLLHFSFWLACVFFVRERGLPFYHPAVIFLLYFFVGFILRPFIIAGAGFSSIWMWVGVTPDSKDAVIASIASVVCLVFFVVVPSIAFPKLYTGKSFQPAFLVPPSPLQFYITVGLIFAIGWISSSKSIGSQAGDVLSYKTVYLERGGQALEGTSGYVTMFADYLIVAVLMLLASTRRYVVLVMVLGTFFALRLSIGSGRSNFISAALAATLIVMSRLRVRTIPVRYALLGLCLLVVFDMLGSNRFLFRDLSAGKVSIGEAWSDYRETRKGAYLTSDFSEFDAATSTIKAVRDSQVYNFGSQYIRLIVWPIPRQIWHSKPVNTDIIDFNHYGRFQVITRSIVGDLYSNFGLLAVAFGAMVISTVMAWFHNKACDTTNASFLVAYLLMFGNLPLLYRHDFVSASYYVLVAVPAILAGVYFGRVKILRNDGASLDSAALRKVARARRSRVFTAQDRTS